MRVPQISDRIKEAPAVALRGFLAGVGQLLLITDRLRNKTGAGEDVPQARTPDASESVPESAQAAAAPPESPAEETPAAPTAPKKRDFNKTGNVRLLTEEDAEPSEPVAAEAAVEAEAAAVEAEAAVEVSEASEVTEAPSQPEAEAPATVTPTTEATEAPATEVSEAEAPPIGELAPDGPALGEPAAEAGAAEAGVAAASGSPADASSALPLANYDELSVASLRARLRNLTAAQVAELAEYEKAHAARGEVVTMFERRIAKLESGG